MSPVNKGNPYPNKIISINENDLVLELALGYFTFGGNKNSKVKYLRLCMDLKDEDGSKHRPSFALSGDFRKPFTDYINTVYEKRSEKLGLTTLDFNNALKLIDTELFTYALLGTCKQLAAEKSVDFSRVKLTNNLITRESKLRYMSLRKNDNHSSFNIHYFIVGTHHNEVVRDSITVDSYKALFYNCAHFCANILLHSTALVGSEIEYAAGMYMYLKGEWLLEFQKSGLVDCDLYSDEFTEKMFYRYVNHAYAVSYGDYLWCDIGGVSSEMIRLMPERKNQLASNKDLFLSKVAQLPDVFSTSELMSLFEHNNGRLERTRLRHRMLHYSRTLCDVVECDGTVKYKLKSKTFTN